MEVTVKIKESNPFKAKQVKSDLQTLANLEPEVIDKLAQLSQKPNAIGLFVANFDELMSM